MSRIRALILILTLALVPAACGDDDASSDTDGDATTTTAAPSGGEASETTEAPETTEASEPAEAPAPSGGAGSATLTVGDQTWEFDSVLCAFGEEEIGQEGAEFVLSALQDGLQLYVSIDSFGHSVSIADIEDFENPSVGFTAGGFTAQVVGGEADIVELSGNQVSADALFLNELTEDFTGIPGSLNATCP